MNCPKCTNPADGLDDIHCQTCWEALCSESWWASVALAQLFTKADEVGDKYLSPEELTERDRILQQVQNDRS